MAKKQPKKIKTVRDGLGFKPGEVAALATITPQRYAEIEATDDLEQLEALRLSDIFGVDLHRVLLGEEELLPSPVGGLLRAQRNNLDVESRAAIARCVGVGRDIQRLRLLLGEPPVGLVGTFRPNTSYDHPKGGLPERLAEAVRNRLRLGVEPIESFGPLWKQLGIVSVPVELDDEGIDAFSVSNEEVGALVICNTRGRHMANAFGRRVTLAHELCHILFDGPKTAKLTEFCSITRSGEDEEHSEKIERRARAFAAHFLAPRSLVEEIWNGQQDVRHLMEEVGMGYEATRGHLASLRLLRQEATIPRVPVDPPAKWERSDPSAKTLASKEALAMGVPLERAGILFELLSAALKRDLISDGEAREFARVDDYETWSKWRARLS